MYMYMYTYIYIYIYIYMYVCMYVYIYIYMIHSEETIKHLINCIMKVLHTFLNISIPFVTQIFQFS
jgi:hypothetical protein